MRCALLWVALLAHPVPVQSEVWTGKLITTKISGIPIQENPAGGKTVAVLGDEGEGFVVRDHQDGMIRIDTKYGVSGWLDQDQATLWHDPVAQVTEMIRLTPGHALLYKQRGVAWEYERAKEVIQSFDANKPKALPVVDIDIMDFTESLRLNPRQADVYTLRGDAWSAKATSSKPAPTTELAIKYLDEAILDYDRALRLDDKSPWHYAARARARLERLKFSFKSAQAELPKKPKKGGTAQDQQKKFTPVGAADVAHQKKALDEANRLFAVLNGDLAVAKEDWLRANQDLATAKALYVDQAQKTFARADRAYEEVKISWKNAREAAYQASKRLEELQKHKDDSDKKESAKKAQQEMNRNKARAFLDKTRAELNMLRIDYNQLRRVQPGAPGANEQVLEKLQADIQRFWGPHLKDK